jgi:hypothetical protein
MGRFRCFLYDLELDELHLHGRLFTWSNERLHPTLERIDRMFVSSCWNATFPRAVLQALSSRCSDHAPLLLLLDDGFHPKRRFRFQAFWPQFEGYLQTVESVWNGPQPDVYALRMVHHLLRGTAKALQHWSAKVVGNIKSQIAVAKKVIFRLEAAQDTRSLSVVEATLRRFLKIRYLGLTSLERTMARQRSSMRWLYEGNANTKFF